MAEYGSPRRYYHRKRMNARAVGDGELEGHWRFKQEQQLPATPLSANFPLRDELAAAGYSVREDLVGADVDELVQVAGMTKREAIEVITALASEILLPA